MLYLHIKNSIRKNEYLYPIKKILFNPFLPRSAVACRRGLRTRDAGACLTRLRTRRAVACLAISRGEHAICCPLVTNQWA